MRNYFNGLCPVWSIHLYHPVKPARAKKRFRNFLHIVGGGDDEHICAAHVVDACLNGDVFFRVAAVTVGRELVHVVKENRRGRVFLCLSENLGYVVNELAVGLVLADGEAPAPHLFDERRGHQRLAHAGHAVQQHAARKIYAERGIFCGILCHVANLH